MQIEIDGERIVDELRGDPELIMDALASFAEDDTRRKDWLLNNIARSDCGSTYHSRVAPWLRRLADALEDAADDA